MTEHNPLYSLDPEDTEVQSRLKVLLGDLKSPGLEGPMDTEDTVDEDVLRAKLEDLETPGFEVTFDPDEAEALGAFREDALSEEDAREASIDKDWEV